MTTVIKDQTLCERVQPLLKCARAAWKHRDDWEKLANLLHPHIPANLRLIPDLTDDFPVDNETKLAIPGFRQLDCYSCGATAGFSVVRAFHPRARFADFYAACNPSPTSGMSKRMLIRALRCHGVGVSDRSRMSFDDIADATERGFPLVAGIGHEFPDGDHWVTIYGVGRKPKRLFVCNQPSIMSLHGREEFMWQEWDRWWNPRGEALVCWGK